MFRLTTFGGLSLSRDGVPLTGAAAQRSRLALLALLASAGPSGISRDKVLLYLWPESDSERARHALKQAVYALRRDLGHDEAIVGTSSLSLNPTLIESDLRDFEAAAARGDHATAASLYAGPFLDGVYLKDAPEFERWSADQRARLAHAWCTAVEHLARDAESAGRWREAVPWRRQLAAAEPLSGRIAVALMRTLAESGDIGAALQHYRVHETMVREELEATPETEVADLAEALRSGSWTRTPPPAPPLNAPSPAEGNVSPPQSTGLVPIAAAPVVSLGSSPGTLLPTPRSSPPRGTGGAAVSLRRARRVRRSVAIASAAAGLAVAMAMVAYFMIPSSQLAKAKVILSRDDPAIVPGRLIVVPFANETGDTTLQSMSHNVAGLISQQLTEAGFLVVEPLAAIANDSAYGLTPAVLRSPNRPLAVARESRAARALMGTYHLMGARRDSLVFRVRLVDVATGDLLVVLPEIGRHVNDRDAIVAALARQALVAVARADNKLPEAYLFRFATPPPSLEAYERVTNAWKAFLKDPTDTARVFAELERASQIEPTWPTPILVRAYVYDVKRHWAGVDSMMKRVKPFVGKLTRVERAAYDVFVADLAGDLKSRIQFSRELARLTPGSSETTLLIVFSALYAGRPQEARAVLAESDPDHGMNLYMGAYPEWRSLAEHYGGTPSEEKRWADRAMSQFPTMRGSVESAIRVMARRGDRKGIDGLLARGLPGADDPLAMKIDLTVIAAEELRAHDDSARSRELFQRAVRTIDSVGAHPDAGWTRRHAEVLYGAGDLDRARGLFRQLLAANPQDIDAIGRLGTIAARKGERTVSDSIASRLASMNDRLLIGRAVFWRAHIAAVLGRTDEAVALIGKAVNEGHRLLDSNPNTVHLDIDFDAVRRSAAYADLLRSREPEAFR